MSGNWMNMAPGPRKRDMINQMGAPSIGDALSWELWDQHSSVKIESILYGSCKRDHVFNILGHNLNEGADKMKGKTSVVLEIETLIRK